MLWFVSLPSCKTLWISFLELGLASRCGFSFLIWDINIMGHRDTLPLLISHLAHQMSTGPPFPRRGLIASITLGDTGLAFKALCAAV